MWKSKEFIFNFLCYSYINIFFLQLSDAEKSKMLEIIDATIKWLDENQDADPERYKTLKTKLENVVNRIISKLYSSTGGVPPPPTVYAEKDKL